MGPEILGRRHWQSYLTPNATLHTLISSEEYSLALKWWLGTPIFPQEEPERTCPGCGKVSDIFGDHLLCCARNNFSKRHQAVQDALGEICSASGQDIQKQVGSNGTKYISLYYILAYI